MPDIGSLGGIDRLDPNTLACIARLRWPDGVECVDCGSRDCTEVTHRQGWRCRDCGRLFSAKVGTVFENSPLGLDLWMTAMWMLVNCKNGVSSCELARSLGVTQKTAWFML